MFQRMVAVAGICSEWMHRVIPIRVSTALNPWRIQAAERGFNTQMSANLTTLNSQWLLRESITSGFM